jgi:hypothetical protein
MKAPLLLIFFVSAALNLSAQDSLYRAYIDSLAGEIKQAVLGPAGETRQDDGLYIRRLKTLVRMPYKNTYYSRRGTSYLFIRSVLLHDNDLVETNEYYYYKYDLVKLVKIIDDPARGQQVFGYSYYVRNDKLLRPVLLPRNGEQTFPIRLLDEADYWQRHHWGVK